MDIEPVSAVDQERLMKVFGDYAKRIYVGKDKAVQVPTYRQWWSKYREFACRPTDVWVVSFPKSGTTWTQEMIWCLLNDLDFDAAKAQVLMKRFPFFEWDGLLPDTPMPDMAEDDPCRPGETWRILQSISDPRPIKSHLHLELLPKNLLQSKAKIVYVCRDPRDVCVSYYFHSKKLDGYTGDFNEFLALFIDDLHFFEPYWKHILDFWNIRNEDNVLFIRYEDLKEDLPGNIRKMCTFLGRTLDDSGMLKLVDHLSFDKMKDNASVNNEALMSVSNDSKQKIPFMRKGKVGDWKEHINADQLEKLKKWTDDKLKDSDFPYYRN